MLFAAKRPLSQRRMQLPPVFRRLLGTWRTRFGDACRSMSFIFSGGGEASGYGRNPVLVRPA